MSLNDLERRNSPYFALFLRNSTDFQAHYITVVEDNNNNNNNNANTCIARLKQNSSGALKIDL